jgi:hypothetical protein
LRPAPCGAEIGVEWSERRRTGVEVGPRIAWDLAVLDNVATFPKNGS